MTWEPVARVAMVWGGRLRGRLRGALLPLACRRTRLALALGHELSVEWRVLRVLFAPLRSVLVHLVLVRRSVQAPPRLVVDVEALLAILSRRPSEDLLAGARVGHLDHDIFVGGTAHLEVAELDCVAESGTRLRGERHLELELPVARRCWHARQLELRLLG